MISISFLLLYLIYSFSFSCYITGSQNCSCLCLTSACHKPLSSELYSSQPCYSHILLFCLRTSWTEVQLAGNLLTHTHVHTHKMYLYFSYPHAACLHIRGSPLIKLQLYVKHMYYYKCHSYSGWQGMEQWQSSRSQRSITKSSEVGHCWHHVWSSCHNCMRAFDRVPLGGSYNCCCCGWLQRVAMTLSWSARMCT